VRWRRGCVRRVHRDGTFLLEYDLDGRLERHVTLDRLFLDTADQSDATSAFGGDFGADFASGGLTVVVRGSKASGRRGSDPTSASPVEASADVRKSRWQRSIRKIGKIAGIIPRSASKGPPLGKRLSEGEARQSLDAAGLKSFEAYLASQGELLPQRRSASVPPPLTPALPAQRPERRPKAGRASSLGRPAAATATATVSVPTEASAISTAEEDFRRGCLMQSGDGDLELAVELLQRACDKGHFGAVTNLGILYAHGREANGFTLEKDEAKAIDLVRSVALCVSI